jgi:hypothetical protein
MGRYALSEVAGSVDVSEGGDRTSAAGVTPTSGGGGRRRFTIACSVGFGIVTIPFTWILFVLWNGSFDLFRNAYPNGYAGNFYSLQARAILTGHLYVPKGSLAIEAWVHGGHDYTYFGVFPSLLRIPVLVITHSYDGRLTALSLFAAWLATGVWSSMLVWRVRTMVRGVRALGRTEAIAYGVIMTSITGGSVLLFLGSTPFVFSEDKAWSVALAAGAFLSLLGMMESPTWGRVATSAAFLVCLNLTRITEGYAGVLAAAFVALWFVMGKGGREQRRWWLPVAGVAVATVATGAAINLAKFGVAFGLPVNDYVAFHLLHEQSINGGHYFDPRYFPTDVVTYLKPWGIRLTSVFPYVTLPGSPPRSIGGVPFDNKLRTASLSASMPVAFVLGCVGVVSVCRRLVDAHMRMLRLLLVAAATGMVGVLFYGWIANRYLADFLPFLILAGAVGTMVVLRWCDERSSRFQHGTLAVVGAVGVFSVLANVGIAITPTEAFQPAQSGAFLRAQIAFSDVTGHPLAGWIERGHRLPDWTPAGTWFIAGDCAALYVSDGEDYHGVLNQLAEHRSWVPVEHGSGFDRGYRVMFGPADPVSSAVVPLAGVGASAVSMQVVRFGPSHRIVTFTVADVRHPASSLPMEVGVGAANFVNVSFDRFRGLVDVSMNETLVLDSPLSSGAGLSSALVTFPDALPPYVTLHSAAPAGVPLCRQLQRMH